MSKIEKVDTSTDCKFLIDGVEHMRVDGIWFKWDKKEVKYVIDYSNGDQYEALYKEAFKK